MKTYAKRFGVFFTLIGASFILCSGSIVVARLEMAADTLIGLAVGAILTIIGSLTLWYKPPKSTRKSSRTKNIVKTSSTPRFAILFTLVGMATYLYGFIAVATCHGSLPVPLASAALAVIGIAGLGTTTPRKVAYGIGAAFVLLFIGGFAMFAIGIHNCFQF